jgi:tRNA/rRNA methyltransferase/tRNA (cytidine32/uridine32-2'-O)-methyltransferase
MNLSDIVIILCRPSESGNVGAVCRVMKNMGLSDLRLAAPLNLDDAIVRSRAVHALDIWENAQIFDTLTGAVADCALVAGTTRRRGHHRKSISMNPRDLASWLYSKTGKVAIVFGNERTGLEEAELNLCNIASHIPVSNAQPSLNLSHAVQIYAYELFLALQEPQAVKGEWAAMNYTEVTTLVDGITGTLADMGFYKHPGREEQSRFLRDIISRAGLMDREGQYLKDIIIKAGRIKKTPGNRGLYEFKRF